MCVLVDLSNVPMEVVAEGVLVHVPVTDIWIDEPVARAIELVSEVRHHQRQIRMLSRGQLLQMLLGHNDGHVALIAKHYAKFILGSFEEQICAAVGMLVEPLSLLLWPTELTVQPTLIFLEELYES